MSELPNKELFRPDEVASYFSLSVKTIYGWIAEGKLEAVKVLGSIRVKRGAIKKIITPKIN